MLYSDDTIFDINGDFIILRNNEEFSFFKVQAKQTQSLQIHLNPENPKPPRIVKPNKSEGVQTPKINS